jgi:hypothetical protein
MSWLEFIASVMRSLAWPVGAVVTAYLLRAPLAHLLMHGVRRAKVGPVELEMWDQRVAEVETQLPEAVPPASPSAPPLSAELRELAKLEPRAAILEAYERLERALRQILEVGGVRETPPTGSAFILARLARDQGLIREESVRAIEGVTAAGERVLSASGLDPLRDQGETEPLDRLAVVG